MIDIHTHILPGVDDGAESFRESLKLIRQAAEGGTKHIVLTPHCAPLYGFHNYRGRELQARFQRLCRMTVRERIPVTLYPGLEILYEVKDDFLFYLDEYVSLCNSRYFLIEFRFDVSEETFMEGIETVKREGMIPVIAHPERYRCVAKNPGLAVEGRSSGARYQINKGSLAGLHGSRAEKTAFILLDQDLVDYIASDAHHPFFRGSRLDRVYRFIKREYGREKAARLFVYNPLEILRGIR